MTEHTRPTSHDEGQEPEYEPPAVEDLESDRPTITAAGGTGTPG